MIQRLLMSQGKKEDLWKKGERKEKNYGWSGTMTLGLLVLGKPICRQLAKRSAGPSELEQANCTLNTIILFLSGCGESPWKLQCGTHTYLHCSFISMSTFFRPQHTVSLFGGDLVTIQETLKIRQKITLLVQLFCQMGITSWSISCVYLHKYNSGEYLIFI